MDKKTYGVKEKNNYTDADLMTDEIEELEVKEESKEQETKEWSPAKAETTVPKTVTNGIIVNAVHVNVRKEPNRESPVVEILRSGDKVKLLEKNEKSEFWKISTSTNKVAYISSKFIKEE